LQNMRISADDPYYGHVRTLLLGLVKGSPKRVLEIGCGHGEALAYLKRECGASFVAGIELVPEVAAIARQKPEIDLVIVGDIERLDCNELPTGSFDLVIASHVLEHVADPWAVTRKLSALLSTNGQLIGSLPNIRNVKVSLPLLLFGKFTYEKEGILDWTHTKFFTKGTIEQLLHSSGLSIQAIEPEFSPKMATLNALTCRMFRNLLCFTYNFSAGAPAQEDMSRLGQA